MPCTSWKLTRQRFRPTGEIVPQYSPFICPEKIASEGHFDYVTDREHIRALIQSKDQPRAALIIAGKELSKRQIVGRKHRVMLTLFRNAIPEGRVVVQAAQSRLKEKSLVIAASAQIT